MSEIEQLKSELERVQDATDAEWLDAIGVAWKRICGKPWETRDGETREEGLSANIGALFDELERTKAAYSERVKEINALLLERDKLNAACAEMREALLMAKRKIYCGTSGENVPTPDCECEACGIHHAIAKALAAARELVI